MKSLEDYTDEEIEKEANRRGMRIQPSSYTPNQVWTVRSGTSYVGGLPYLITWTSSAGFVNRDMPYALVEKYCPHLKEEIDRRVKRIHDTGRDDG